jgi:hypothetical protein
MTTATQIASQIEQLRDVDFLEPAHLYQVTAAALGARGTTDFETAGLFTVADVFQMLASKFEGTSDESIGSVKGIISLSSKVLAQSEWEAGRADLTALIGMVVAGERRH